MRFSLDEQETGNYTSNGDLIYIRSWQFDMSLVTSSNPQEKVFTTEGIIDELVDGYGSVDFEMGTGHPNNTIAIPTVWSGTSSVQMSAQIYRNADGNLVAHFLGTNAWNGVTHWTFTAHYTKKRS